MPDQFGGSIRRVALAIAAISIGSFILHAQLADAVILRGDDMLIQNRYKDASKRYARALWLDPASKTAVDRYAFVALQERTPRALRDAAGAASGYLRAGNRTPAIIFDRALCYLLLKQYALALPDFDLVARITKDPQAFTFAGWAAKRSGNLHKAAMLWKAAIRLHPGYRPALDALAQLKRR